MAEATLVTCPVYELKLSEREAKLIKNLTQNSFYPSPDDEPASETLDRESIFNTLTKAGVK